MLRIVLYSFPSKRGFPVISDSSVSKLIPLATPGALNNTILFFKNSCEELDLGVRKDALSFRFRSNSHFVYTLKNLFFNQLQNKGVVTHLTLASAAQMDTFFFHFSWLKMYPTLIFLCATPLQGFYVLRISKFMSFYYQNRGLFFLQQPKRQLLILLLHFQQRLLTGLGSNVTANKLTVLLAKR